MTITDGAYRYDLKAACKNCPFKKGDEAIRFRGSDRAAEISELAYREGFVCHLTGECDDYDDGGIRNKRDGSSQHCFGALWLHMQDGFTTIPFENLSEDDQMRWWEEIPMDKINKARDEIFESEDDFIEASA